MKFGGSQRTKSAAFQRRIENVGCSCTREPGCLPCVMVAPPGCLGEEESRYRCKERDQPKNVKRETKWVSNSHWCESQITEDGISSMGQFSLMSPRMGHKLPSPLCYSSPGIRLCLCEASNYSQLVPCV